MLHERNRAEPGGVNEAIHGLSIDTDGKINVEVDADKTCYCICPDGSVLASTDGIIEEVWEGDPGKVVLLIPKDTNILHLGSAGTIEVASDFIGDLVVNLAGVIDVTECISLTSVEAPNASELVCSGNGPTSLTSLSALKATVLICNDSENLTAQSIYDALDNAYKLGLAGVVDGVYTFSGSTTAIDLATISQRHGISYDAIVGYLGSEPNWTITVNEA